MKILLLALIFLIFTQISYCQTLKLEDVKQVRIRGNKEDVIAFRGIVYVNENHNDASSKKIHIPVLVAKSFSDTPKEPIFWLAGGPGQSNMNFRPTRYLLENHDVILVGYRGVDGMVKLNSKKISKAMKGLNHSLLSDESLDNLGNIIDEYFEEISSSVDINAYNIVNVIEDFEVVRKALGYDKINLLSSSYGTRVALTYSYLYPEVINRTVMVGANPHNRFIWHPEKTSEIIKYYDSIYQNSSNRVLGESIERNIKLALEKMPKRWTLFRLDQDKIKIATFLMLYNKENAVIAFNSYYKAAKNNDYSGLYLMQLLYDYIFPRSFIWGDLFLKAATVDYDNSLNYRELLQVEKSSLGAPLSLFVIAKT